MLDEQKDDVFHADKEQDLYVKPQKDDVFHADTAYASACLMAVLN